MDVLHVHGADGFAGGLHTIQHADFDWTLGYICAGHVCAGNGSANRSANNRTA
jgi:hypothetical protein